MKLLLILILLFSEAGFALSSYTPFTHSLKEGNSRVEFMGEYYKNHGIKDVNGKSFSFRSSDSYQRLDSSFKGSYAFTDRLEGSVWFNMRYISSKSEFTDTNQNTKNLSFTKSSPESIFASLKYSFKRDNGLQYSIEGEFGNSLYTNKTYDGVSEPQSDELAIGDDSRKYGVGLSISLLTRSQNVFGAKVMYRDYGKDLSPEIYSLAEYALVWQKVSLVGGVENVFSRGEDAFTNDPGNKPKIYQGSTNLYNSINRSWNAPYLTLKFRLGDKWRMDVRYKEVISGASTDLGRYAMINFIRTTRKDSSYTDRVNAFKEYEIEAVVTRLSKSRSVAIIDKGLAGGLSVGMKIDFYHFDYVGGNKLIARGRVIKTSSDKSMVKIYKRYSKKRVEEGTFARGGEIK